MVVCFRNDDVAATCDVEHERRIADVFEQYRVPQTIAVIPFAALGSFRDRDSKGEAPLASNAAITRFVSEYVARSGSEIALHGYSHRTNRFSMPGRREFFEFRRIGLQEQTDLIGRGTEMVSTTLGVRPFTFVPPWNRLDANTLRACKDHGYTAVSADTYTPTADGLVSLGTDCDLGGLPRRLAHAAQQGRPALFRVLFHSPTMRTDGAIQNLERALQAATQTEGCECLTLAQIVARYPAWARGVNEAAKNVVTQDNVAGSSRARSSLYVRAVGAAGLQTGLHRNFRKARDAYLDLRYEDAATLGPTIDRQAERFLFAGRVASFAAGFAGGAALHVAQRSLAFPNDPWLVAAVAGTAGAIGAWLRWKSSSPDTRREFATATILGVCGFLAATILLTLR